MVGAAGESVHIHHVGERGGAVDEVDAAGWERQHIIQIIGIGNIEFAGLVIHGAAVIAAGGREFILLGQAAPGLAENLQRIGDGRVIAAVIAGIVAASGEGQHHYGCQQNGNDLFHATISPSFIKLFVSSRRPAHFEKGSLSAH